MFQQKTSFLMRSFLLTLVLATTAVPVAAEEQVDVRLGDAVVPTFQRIELELDASTDTYTGSVGVKLLVRKATNTFQFHAEAMNLESITLRMDGEHQELNYEVSERGVVTVTTKYTLKPGEAELGIIFDDDFNTDAVGLYRMEHEGVGYSFTQFQADDGREAFPMWDEPGFKIPYQMIITVPGDHMAVTNTPIEEEKTLPDGRKRIVFQKTKPMPSYLLAIATGPLEEVEIPGLGVPGRVITVKGQSHLAQIAIDTTPPILKALETYFDSKYPYEKCDLIAVPEYWPGAMENPGAITYSDALLLLDPEAATIGQKRLLVKVTAHELAHMWFGDLVTMKWWDDLWLNESFADWMGDKIANEVYPDYKVGLSFTTDAQQIMMQDARPSTGPVRRPVLTTDKLMEDVGLAYSKGKAVLAMFEEWLGPEDFRKGVLAYIEANAWANATADDLWKHLDKASGKKMSEAMATFIEQPGFPVIQLELQDGGKAKITQTRFHNYGATVEGMTWKIPVGLKYSVNGEVKDQMVFLDKKSMTVDLGGTPDWITVNEGAKGYYRWSAAPELMTSLADQAQEVLEPEERIEFLYNQMALLLAGSLGGNDILRGLNAFGEDQEPLVLSTVLGGVDRVKTAFVPRESEDAFAVYVRRTLGPAMERVGYEARPGEDETINIIRPRLIAYLGDEGQVPEAKAFAKKMAMAYLADPQSVDPALASISLRLAAHDGDRALFDAYKAKLEAATTPIERRRFLSTLGSFRDPELRETALTYALEGPLRPQELFTISQSIGGTEEGADRLFEWMTQNYDDITGRIPPMFASYMPFFAGGCSEDRLESARAFFSDPAHQVPGTLNQLEKVADQVGDCLNLREREGEAAMRYLSTLEEETGDE